LIDFAAGLALRGLLRLRPLRHRAIAGGSVLALIVAVGSTGGADAQAVVADGTADRASLTTRLAYVRTGDFRLDEISRAGLAGLTAVVGRRTAAELGEFDLVKVSYAALPWLLDSYELLPCGGALGRGCGPLVLVRDRSLASLAARRVAVPGDRTTAYLLMRLWSADEPPASESGGQSAG